MKTTAKEITVFDSKLFDWFSGHEGPGDTSLSRLSLPPKGKSPYFFNVNFPTGQRTFALQYHVTADSDGYDSKYMAVYWCGDQIVHVHCC